MTLNGGTLNIAGSLSTSATGGVDWTADATLTGAGLSLDHKRRNDEHQRLRHALSSTAARSTTTARSTGAAETTSPSITRASSRTWPAACSVSPNDQIIYQYCCAAGQAFSNAGTFRKAGATATTTISSNGFNNTGTVEADSGVIAFNSGFTSSGSPVYSFGIGNATTFGHLTFSSPVTLTGH